MRVEEAEREVEVLRDELAQAQHRISTLLEMGQPGFEGGSEDGDGNREGERRDSLGSSEEASMAFDKVGHPPLPVHKAADWMLMGSSRKSLNSGGDQGMRRTLMMMTIRPSTIYPVGT
jgi:hypothetical protein